MNMSDGRRGRLRHADTVDGDVMGSMGMGGKAIVSVMDVCFALILALTQSSEKMIKTVERRFTFFSF